MTKLPPCPIEGCKSEEEANFDPTQLKVLLTLAVATSIDALAIGISFAERLTREKT